MYVTCPAGGAGTALAQSRETSVTLEQRLINIPIRYHVGYDIGPWISGPICVHIGPNIGPDKITDT